MKILKAIGIFFAILIFGGMIIGTIRDFTDDSSSYSAQTIVVEKNIYSIRYVGVINGKQVEIPYTMKSGVTLPKTYISGGSAKIDDLRDGMGKNYDYEFLGWYRDAELTQPFGGYISYTDSSNLTLYAHIRTYIWSDNYT